MLTWTRSHSLRVDLPADTDTANVVKELRNIPGITGQDSTATVLTMGFAHRYTQGQLRRGPYRNVREVLIKHGVITPSTRALQAA